MERGALTWNRGRTGKESGSLQEVGGGLFSIDLKLVGINGGVDITGGGGGHWSRRRGGRVLLVGGQRTSV